MSTHNSQNFDPIILSLSVRARNCCEAEGIHTIEELSAYAAMHDLMNVRNCGRKTAMELQEAIEKYGRNGHNSHVECTSIIPESLSSKVEEVFDNHVLTLEDNDIFNCLCDKFSTATSFLNSIVISPYRLFEPITELTYKQNIKLWDCLMLALFRISNIAVSNPLEARFANNVQKAYQSCLNFYKAADNKLLIQFIPGEAMPVVKQEYAKCVKKLGTRARNYIKSARLSPTTILDILDRAESDKSFGQGYGIGTIVELIREFDGYKNFLVGLTETDKADIESLTTQYEFPYLTAQQVNDVISYREQEGYLPFFFIVRCFFDNSKEREPIMFNRANGITVPIESLNNIAASYNLTRERVRQIVMRYKPIQLVRLANTLSAQQYPFLEDQIIDIDKCFADISEAEFSRENDVFSAEAFATILSFFKPYRVYDFNGSKFLLSSSFEKSFDFKNAWIDVTKALNSKTSEDVQIPVDFFINNYILSNNADYQAIRDLIIQLVVKTFDVEIDDNFNILLHKNSIDFEAELYNIIEQAGKPMFVDDILDAFYEAHPDYATKSPTTLRIIMINSPRIKSVGKTSTFTLTKWNFSTLTVRSLIAAILQESDVPLSLDTIVEILETKGRKTNRSSVNSSILTDTKNNFVKYKGGLVGIGSKVYDSIYEIQDPEALARKSFSIRLKEYLEFVDTNQHIPFSSSDEEEASLYRWFRNVEKGSIDVSQEQKELLHRELNKRQQFIMTKTEFTFSQKCADFKYYVSTEFDIPSQKTDSSLYLWFLKARKESAKFSPKMKDLYNDLIDFLAQYGFSFE